MQRSGGPFIHPFIEEADRAQSTADSYADAAEADMDVNGPVELAGVVVAEAADGIHNRLALDGNRGSELEAEAELKSLDEEGEDEHAAGISSDTDV